MLGLAVKTLVALAAVGRPVGPNSGISSLMAIGVGCGTGVGVGATTGDVVATGSGVGATSGTSVGTVSVVMTSSVVPDAETSAVLSMVPLQADAMRVNNTNTGTNALNRRAF